MDNHTRRRLMREAGLPTDGTEWRSAGNPRQLAAEAQGIEYRAVQALHADSTDASVRELQAHLRFAKLHPPSTRTRLPWLSTFTDENSAKLRNIEVNSAATIVELVQRGSTPAQAARVVTSQTRQLYRDEAAAEAIWLRVAELAEHKTKRNERKGRRKSFAERPRLVQEGCQASRCRSEATARFGCRLRLSRRSCVPDSGSSEHPQQLVQPPTRRPSKRITIMSCVISVPAGSTAVASGVVLDNEVPLTTHTGVCTGSSGIESGACTLDVSQDGVEWISTALAATASTVTKATVTGAYRFVRASIGTTIEGGSVEVTVASV